jgi:hypothetical protein
MIAEEARGAAIAAEIEEFLKNPTYSSGYVRTLHGALQFYVTTCTSFAGLPTFKLLDQTTYSMVYKAFSHQNPTSGAVDNHVHNVFTKEDLHRIAKVRIRVIPLHQLGMNLMNGDFLQKLKNSDKRRDVVSHSLLTFMVPTLARGDDARKIRFRDVSLRNIGCIGKWPY